MQLLTIVEFADRCRAVQEALQIFGHMTDNDITRAFQAYQDILAGQTMPVQHNTRDHGRRAPTVLDAMGRPHCPDCDSEMMLRRVPPNAEGVKTQFICSNKNCDLVLDSVLTFEEVLNEMREDTNARLKQTEPPL